MLPLDIRNKIKLTKSTEFSLHSYYVVTARMFGSTYQKDKLCQIN